MHTLVDTKASKLDHLRKATHPGTFLYRQKSTFIRILQYLQCTPQSGIYSLFIVTKTKMQHVVYCYFRQCHQPNTDLVTKNGESEELQ